MPPAHLSPPDPALEPLRQLQQRLRTPLAAEAVREVTDEAVAISRQLYVQARSGEALTLARALLDRCTEAGAAEQRRRAATLCGILSGDTGDIVGAIEYQVIALRIGAAEENREAMSLSWNSIGLAIASTGNYELAASCYRRALGLVEPIAGPVHMRLVTCSNLAQMHYFLGSMDEGMRYGERALQEMTPEFMQQDVFGCVQVLRNLVRLLVAKGRLVEARDQMAHAVALADREPSQRTRIAADVTRAAYEIAAGQPDVALTRLEQALVRAREFPAAWRETLVCLVRAEEAAGSPARALVRLEELSRHVYDLALQRARVHMELAGLKQPSVAGDPEPEQVKARLIPLLDAPLPPEGWKTLQRLAVGAALRMDPSGWHGMRVGALSKALALAAGVAPLHALEIGLAAQLHDIGMASVPEGVLAKPGILNAAEHAIVRRHIDAGAEMLADDRHPRILLAREIARYHHARWDGKGYPERVGGHFIPLGARICAITDAYDMMATGLGGRPARTMAEALEELRRCAGSQFDPELVEAFAEMVRNESEGLGLDLDAGAGMRDFQELVLSLQEDRGFV